jgi:hypothetical protein
MTWKSILKTSTPADKYIKDVRQTGPYNRCWLNQGSSCVRPTRKELDEGLGMCSYCQDDASKWSILPDTPDGFFKWENHKRADWLDSWVKKNPEGWHKLHDDAADMPF